MQHNTTQYSTVLRAKAEPMNHPSLSGTGCVVDLVFASLSRSPLFPFVRVETVGGGLSLSHSSAGGGAVVYLSIWGYKWTSTAQYGTLLDDVAHYSVVQYCRVLLTKVANQPPISISAVLHSAVLCCAVLFLTVL